MIDDETPDDPLRQSLDARRLKDRMAAVLSRAKPVPVVRDDGTILLRGRRRRDRDAEALDRRLRDRRRS